MNNHIIIRKFASSDREAMIGLTQRQDERLHGLDGRLRPLPSPATFGRGWVFDRYLVTYKTNEQSYV